MFLPNKAPNQTALKHRVKLSTMLNEARIKSPLSNKFKVSIEKDEKVVKPPRNPINNKARNCSLIPLKRSNKKTNKNPMRNEPTTFTTNVP